eukprot:GILK01009540.1.p1 GENE.GILK01009540.1~~GILK01009540.1.p1  ORF type:complete len:1082 (+),score=147.92 GILK01009540.1:36-3248(+)
MSNSHVALTFFGRASAKVHNVDVHPVRPWAVSADESGCVSLWDYEQKVALRSFSPQALEAERRDYAILTKRLDEVGSFSQSLEDPSGEAANTKLEKLGTVNALRFVDADVIRWQYGGSIPIRSSAAKACPHHWVVVALQNRVLFFDYVSTATRTISLPMMDYKFPMAVEMVCWPYLAIGGSDGLVRVWDCESWRTFAVLGHGGTGHLKSISCLTSFMFPVMHSPLVLSGSVDGSICVWDIFDETAPQRLDRLGPNRTQPLPAFDGSVTAISVNMATRNIVCLGNDKTIAIWAADSYRELIRFKNVRDHQKAAFNSLSVLLHPGHLNDMTLLTSKSSVLVAAPLTATGGAVRADRNGDMVLQKQDVFDLRQFLVGVSKNYHLKMYCLKPHPLDNSLLCLGTNHGIFVVRYGWRVSPNGVSSPIWTVPLHPSQFSNRLKADQTVLESDADETSPSHASSIGSASGAVGSSVQYFATKDHLCCKVFLFERAATVTETVSPLERKNSKIPPKRTSDDVIRCNFIIAKLCPLTRVTSGQVVLSKSASSRYLAVFFPSSCQYNIYALFKRNYRDPLRRPALVTSGDALSFCWAANDDMFAVVRSEKSEADVRATLNRSYSSSSGSSLSSAAVTTPTPAPPVKRGSKLAPPVPPPPAAAPPSFAVFRIENGEAKIVKSREVMTEFPLSCFGGHLLCICYGSAEEANLKPTESSADLRRRPSEVSSANVTAATEAPVNVKCRFYTWETLEPLNDGFATPSNVYWSQGGDFVALAYDKEFYVYSTQPGFKLIGRYYFQIQSAIWSGDAFVFVSTNSVDVLFPRVGGESTPVCLASYTYSPLNSSESLVVASTNDTCQDLLPPIQPRPAGKLSVLGIVQGRLVLADTCQRLHGIALDHTGIRFCLTVALGRLPQAMECAQKMHSRTHDQIAAFLEAAGFVDAALSLSGLSAAVRVGIIARHKRPLQPMMEVEGFGQSWLRKLALLYASVKDQISLRTLYQKALSAERLTDAAFIATFLDDDMMKLHALQSLKRFAQAAAIAKRSAAVEPTFVHDLMEQWNVELSEGIYSQVAVRVDGPPR